MARPQEFNTQEVLKGALSVFWLQGYDGTTLQDLLKATGLSKSSLYSSFGDKHALFLAAFDTYRRERHEHMQKLMEQSRARDAIEAFFRDVVADANSSKFVNGCMSTNQAVEMAPRDPQIRQRVEADFLFIEDQLAAAVERGQREGNIATKLSARGVARMLLVAFAGFQVLARSRCGKDRLDDALSTYLAILD